jgi:hypothetical protein
MTLSFQSTGLGSTGKLALVRQLASSLESAGENRSFLGLPGGGISVQIEYDLAGASALEAHLAIFEGAKRAAEQASFYLIDVAVSQVVSKAVEATLVGAAAGLAGGAKANSPWVLIGAGVIGAMAGNLIGSDIKSELPYLIGTTDAYGRWWLQEAPRLSPGGVMETVGHG